MGGNQATRQCGAEKTSQASLKQQMCMTVYINIALAVRLLPPPSSSFSSSFRRLSQPPPFIGVVVFTACESSALRSRRSNTALASLQTGHQAVCS